MGKCPECGFETPNPVKTWQMTSRPSKQGDIRRLTIGFYECPNCKTKFRRVLEKERINLKAIMERIKALEETLMEATQKRTQLEEKLKTMEEEKASLLTEIEALKAIPELEAKIASLEPEVAKLKEEKKALEEKTAPPPPPPPEEAAPTEAPAETPVEAAAPAPAAEEKPSEGQPCE